jgi:hypothetical protein
MPFDLQFSLSLFSRHLSYEGVITMEWYHNEANEQNSLEQDEAHKQRVIQQSNFWAKLQRRIEQDVAGINATEFWAKRLAGQPLTAKNSEGSDDYLIRKAGYPPILITLRHQGDHVEVERDFADNRGVEQYGATEQLTIGSDGKHVYLHTEGNKRLAVPEQAAEYILRPIIESLKTTKGV